MTALESVTNDKIEEWVNPVIKHHPNLEASRTYSYLFSITRGESQLIVTFHI